MVLDTASHMHVFQEVRHRYHVNRVEIVKTVPTPPILSQSVKIIATIRARVYIPLGAPEVLKMSKVFEDPLVCIIR